MNTASDHPVSSRVEVSMDKRLFMVPLAALMIGALAPSPAEAGKKK